MTTLPTIVNNTALAYQATSAGSSTATFTKAALETAIGRSLAVGDILIAHIHQRSSTAGTWTVPSGWTQAFTPNTVNHQWGVWYYTIPDSSTLSAIATTWAFTVSSAVSRMAGALYVRAGVNLANPLNVVGALSAQTASSSCLVPTITTTINNCAIDNYFNAVQQTTNAGSTVTPNTGLTEIYEIVGGAPVTAASDIIEMGTFNKATAGATGDLTAGVSPSVTNTGGIMLAWAPVPDANTAPTVTAPATISNIEPGDKVVLTFTEADADANIDPKTRKFRIISLTGASTPTVTWNITNNVVTLIAPSSLSGAVITYGYTVADLYGVVSTEVTGVVNVLANTRRILMSGGSFKPILKQLNDSTVTGGTYTTNYGGTY